MSVITLTTGQSFDAGKDDTILDSASNNQIFLPYSCRSGRCSSCKCKLIAGSSIAIYPETGLTEKEKKDGWILSCVRRAETDITIDVGEVFSEPLPEVRTLPCRVKEVEYVSQDVIKVLLRLPPNAVFEYLAGQYVDVIGHAGIRRSYSIANATPLSNTIELHIRRVANGEMSDYWFRRVQINDLLRLRGPLGTFFLRDLAGLKLYFLATGTGIAPVKAMLESLQVLPSSKLPTMTTVIWGGRSERDLYLDIEGAPGEHTFVPVLSRGGKSWLGESGYVQDALLRREASFDNIVVYACGSGGMIASARQVLGDAGLEPNHFFADAFVCTAKESLNEENNI